MALAMRPLTPVFAAEVTGFSIRDGVGDGDFAAIERAFNDYGVLVFPEQPVSDAEQIAFSERFGPLEATLTGAVGTGTKLARISNLLPDGSKKDPASQLALFTRANLFWHTDSSFKPVPAMASLLSARILPKAGGDTEFASTRAAFEALPPETQARLEQMIAVHWIVTSRLKLSPDAVTEAQRREMPPVQQALVRTNPVTGRKSLLIGSHVTHIEGLPDDDALALNEELVRLATLPRHTYRHRWRPHDIVMWDNRAVLHRGHPYDEAGDERLLLRTTVAGTGPTVVDGRIVEAA
jgi:alpha-ketoglutarate-dependent 2,4-dichlorophenoxyacetate dioxygenase